MVELIVVAVLALAAGLLFGWLWAGRRHGALASDLAVAQNRAADADLVRKLRDEVERERNAAHQELAALKAQSAAREEAHRAAVQQLRDSMEAQFNAAAAKALETAQAQFLDRAQQRFT